MLVRVILILIPFLLYFLWLRYRKRKAAAISAEDARAAKRAEREIFWAAIGLVIFAVASVAVLRMQEAASPSETYVPPHTENGTIVPGHFE